MKHLLLLAPLALMLEACPGPVGSIPAPSNIADATVRDEQALLGAELAYKAARIAVEILVDSGQCTGECATNFRRLNRQGYETLQTARAIYASANSESLGEMIAALLDVTDDMLNLTGRNQ